MSVTNIHEAKAHLSQLIERAAEGEEVIISRAGKPVAKLTPYPEANTEAPAEQKPSKPARKGGFWRGRIWISENFDDPLPSDIQAAFEGEGD